MQVLKDNISDILDLHEPLQDCVIHNNRVWTYGEVSNLVKNTSQWLAEQGVKPGNVVATMLSSEISTFIAMLSIARLGATVLTLSDNMAELPRQQLFSRCQVTHLISDIGIGIDDSIVIIEVDELRLLSMAHRPSGSSHYCRKPQSPWSIIVGSGSTGKPKLMAVTHEQQIVRTGCAPQWLPYDQADTVYSFVSIKFNVTKQRYLEALFCGASILLSGKDTEIQFKTTRISVLYGTVYHFEKLLEMGLSAANTNEEKPLTLLTGGSTASRKFRNLITRTLTPNLYVLYGTNETYTGSITRLDEVLALNNNVGRPYPGYCIEIVDSKGKNLPVETEGEVRIRFPGMITAYLDDPVASKKAFRDGWFYPGDIGAISKDGQLIHMGRLDDLMQYNGINIYPAEIEQTLLSHPNVIEACAFPIDHPVHHNIPVCVVLVDSLNTASEAKLQRYSMERAATIGARVFIIDKIPRNSRGKVNRKALREYALIRFKDNASALLPTNSIEGDVADRKIQVTFKLPDSSSLGFRQLHGWLVDALEISDPSLTSLAEYRVEREPQIYLDYVFSLSENLFQQCYIPVFEPPKVVAIAQAKQDPSVYQVVFKFNEVEMLASDMYTHIFNMSFKLCSWMSENDLTTNNKTILYKRIYENIIKPLRSKMPIGKSNIPVLRVAHEKGIPIRHLGIGVFKLGWGSKARFLDKSVTEDDSVIASQLTHSKFNAVRILRKAGLPVPVHELVESEQSALKAANRIGYPVVVKPNDLDRGEGVSVDITDDAALSKAFEISQAVAPNKQVLIEKQADGVCHRVFISKGRLLYAVKRSPISIVGDGQHTVQELVKAETDYQRLRPSWLRSEMQPMDDMARKAIAGAGYTLDSVPELGAFVPLRRIESTQWGGIDDEVSSDIHPENLRIAIDAANIFGLNAAGVDIITSDITKPWFETNAIINEVNFSPLLGRASISLGYIPEFIARLIDGDGKIPIERISSKTPKKDALKRQAEFKVQGLRCYVTCQDETIDFDNKIVHMPFSSQEERVSAILERPDADALVIYERKQK